MTAKRSCHRLQQLAFQLYRPEPTLPDRPAAAVIADSETGSRAEPMTLPAPPPVAEVNLYNIQVDNVPSAGAKLAVCAAKPMTSETDLAPTVTCGECEYDPDHLYHECGVGELVDKLRRLGLGKPLAFLHAVKLLMPFVRAAAKAARQKTKRDRKVDVAGPRRPPGRPKGAKDKAPRKRRHDLSPLEQKAAE